jgi:GDP-L-fucose synthase
VRAVVTDASGLIGAALVRALRRRGADVALGVDAIARAPDVVFACSGRSGGVHTNLREPASLMLDNLQHTLAIHRAAEAAGVDRLIYFASSCCYPRECAQPMREESLFTGPVEPTSEAYAVAKLAGIALCAAVRRERGRRYTAIVPADCYGPGDDFHPERSHVLAALVRRFVEARDARLDEVVVWGTGAPVRDFLFADDLAEAAVVVAERDVEGPINVGSGAGTSIRALAAAIRDAVRFEGALRFDPTRPDGAPRKVLDSARVGALGWAPRVSLSEGVLATVRWYENGQACPDPSPAV